MIKGVETIARKVLAILAEDYRPRATCLWNRDWTQQVTRGELRRLAESVTARPVLATARPKKPGKSLPGHVAVERGARIGPSPKRPSGREILKQARKRV